MSPKQMHTDVSCETIVEIWTNTLYYSKFFSGRGGAVAWPLLAPPVPQNTCINCILCAGWQVSHLSQLYRACMRKNEEARPRYVWEPESATWTRWKIPTHGSPPVHQLCPSSTKHATAQPKECSWSWKWLTVPSPLLETCMRNKH
jgi:hypothetical protein